MAIWRVRQAVDMAHPRSSTEYVAVPVAVGDCNAIEWAVDVFGADMAGCTLRVDAIRADGNTVVSGGTVSGTTCSCVMHPETYAYSGQVTAVMKLAKGDDLVSLGAICFYVRDGLIGGIVDPGRVMRDLAELEADIDAFEDRLTAIENRTVDITIAGISDLYVQATEPTNATDGSIWIDTGTV